MSRRSSRNESERNPEEEGRLGSQAPSGRRIWNWFGALFGLVVFVGASFLYLSARAPAIDETMAIDQQGSSSGDALDNHNRLQEPVLVEESNTGAVDETTSPLASDETLGVLVGVFVVDSFGFHDLEETYAEATEVNDRDAGRIARVIVAVDTVEWPAQLQEAAGAFRADVVDTYRALQSGDLEGVRHGLEGVHSTQHDLSKAVYRWLEETAGSDLPEVDAPSRGGAHNETSTTTADDPNTETTVSGDDEKGVIEVEMFEFGYTPNTLDIRAGEPVTLRFTNRGKLPHEAMVGDAHMQEEFAAAGDHDDGEGGDDHHGNMMATLVQPGETQDLEVVIDEPGTWYVACHLVGHYEAGQVATINVGA